MLSNFSRNLSCGGTTKGLLQIHSQQTGPDNDSHLGNRVAGKAEMFNAFYASVLDTDGPGRSGLS